MVVRTSKLILVLALAGLAAGGAEAAVPPAKSADPEAARRAVLPDAACGVFVRAAHVPAPGETLVYYKGYSKPDTSGLVGYTVTARGRGYSSTIETVVGLDLKGRIAGMKIVSQAETQGIGNKIVEVRATKTASAALAALPAEAAGSRRVVLAPEGALACLGCLVVAVKDAAALADLERAVASGDTAAAADKAPAALAVSGAEASVLGDRAVAFAVSARVVEALRRDAPPWWQAQFVGKSAQELVLAKSKADGSIQAITGATVSSRAVTESVKSAIVKLEQALGGFKPAAGSR
jgi:Na+-translocating ferredoxin:NAD+ oxidoreductase RnfG subunit